MTLIFGGNDKPYIVSLDSFAFLPNDLKKRLHFISR